MSLGETQLRPTAMLFRNLASMDVEESIRGNPIDGVVLLMGCDKTTPSLMMGAASCDLPTIGSRRADAERQVPRPGHRLGHRRLEDERDGACRRDDARDFTAAESCMHRSKGSCMTMGTARRWRRWSSRSGMSLPENAAIPARTRAATGSRSSPAGASSRWSRRSAHVEILTRTAFENAIRTNAAIGGSTNAVVHLLAIAGRIGVDLKLADWDRLGAEVPCLVDLQPSGRFLMEDFYYAGGLPAVLREISHLLHLDAPTVNGRHLGENIAEAPCWNREVIRPLDKPLLADAGIAVVRGNLAPGRRRDQALGGFAHLLKHRGRAVVFESIEDFHARIDDEALDIDENCVMVLKNCGPRGYPGMAEVGNMPLPPKVLRKGITDMVRISDARMSGTAYGTVVLHTSPEAAAGGTARPRARRGHDRARRPRAQPDDRGLRRGTRPPPRRVDAARAARARMGQALRGSRAAGAPRGGPRLPRRIERRRHPARLALSIHIDKRYQPG
jgi:dihydroxy-acid dehydratase